MISNGLIFADHDVYIRQVVPNDGGRPKVIPSSAEPGIAGHPARVPVFLSARRISPGQCGDAGVGDTGGDASFRGGRHPRACGGACRIAQR